MCGIAGIVHFSEKRVDPQRIQAMLRRIKHRGPDDEGTSLHGNVGLGHVRLSIIDLSSAGHQPMLSADSRYSLVFNGEIYNYLELKKELAGQYDFRTRTDSEVLLAAYIVWGEKCLNRFNGDFAFAIYDTVEKTLFGARDRFGIKPFYYQHSDSEFIFASEIKALLPEDKKLSPNNKIIFEYLVYNRTDQSEETFFDSIHKLKHGHSFTLRKGQLKIDRWYTLGDQINYPTTLRPEEFRYELNKSIGLRLRSDVPVGVCLSGGIDSSSITSILYNDFKLTGLQTFSAVFNKNDPEDESGFINTYKPQLNNMNYTSPSAGSFYTEFSDFIVSQCEPMPGISPYTQYKVMQLAKGKVSVTLDGQGADEMLGGYNYFYGSYFKELLKSYRILALLRETGAHYRKNSSKEAFSYFGYYLLPVILKNYFGRKNGSISKDFYHSEHKNSTISADLYNPSSLHAFFLQHFEYKLEHLLKWDDLNSMSFSIESRIPFLDHHLVEKTLSLPANQILKNGISKYILRESVKDILPSAIYNRTDKIGFGTPADEWLRSKPFCDFVNNMLNSNSFISRGYFDVSDCKQKFRLHQERKANLSKDIWKWINLEIWFQKFIDP
jgi:asparagine synthase (glutamine-hydrolysing)